MRKPISEKRRDTATLERAVLETVAYADVFDYPLTSSEVYRYLVGVVAHPDQVTSVLSNGRLAPRYLSRREGFVTLAGREDIVATRYRRRRIAAEFWPPAIRYGRLIARLPFVRLVAVTGALAVDNVESDTDIDYLIVTQPGRLWLCRALVIGVVRVAERAGVWLCPNYFLSERALVFEERTLYTAHELTQMVPIAGLDVYRQIRRLNAWTERFLPNAVGRPRQAALCDARRDGACPVQRMTEALLRTPAGTWLEQWEMERKVRKFSRRANGHQEADFCADWCKGHFDNHGERILESFRRRLVSLGVRESSYEMCHE